MSPFRMVGGGPKAPAPAAKPKEAAAAGSKQQAQTSSIVIDDSKMDGPLNAVTLDKYIKTPTKVKEDNLRSCSECKKKFHWRHM